jgi:hypothetical protein
MKKQSNQLANIQFVNGKEGEEPGYFKMSIEFDMALAKPGDVIGKASRTTFKGKEEFDVRFHPDSYEFLLKPDRIKPS